MRDCSTLGVCQDRPIRCAGCVPGLRDGRGQSPERGVPHAVPRLLHPSGAERAPEQTAGGRHAGGDRAISGRAWPGADFGVRASGIDETPLSRAEAVVAMREGFR